MKKCIKTFLWTLLGLLLLGAVAVLSVNAYVKHTTKDAIVTPETIPGAAYDCILVLGCGVYDNGVPSNMLADRLDRAIALYHQGAAPKLLMSGDHGRTTYDEVNTMRTYAMERGVPSDDIFMDHAGFSTYESMYRARDIFLVQNMIVITQEYHLYRALYVAEKLGLCAVGVDADLRPYLGQTYRDVREVAARCKDFVTCIFRPEPTFLGDTIPVSGDGRATWD